MKTVSLLAVLVLAKVLVLAGRHIAWSGWVPIAYLWQDVLVVLLFVANTINIGADLAAMGDAAELATGGSAHVFTVAFAIMSLLLQLFLPYKRYAGLLKWLTLTLLAYVAVLLMVRLDWAAAAKGLVVPTIAEARAAFATTYDVVLVDYDLDDGKGDALVSWIRDVAADQKLVAISSRDDGNERLRAAGADATCAKIDFAAIGWVLAELSS